MPKDDLKKIDGVYNNFYYNLAPVNGKSYAVWFTCKGWRNIHRLRKTVKTIEQAEQVALKILHFYMQEERVLGKVVEPEVIRGFTKTEKHRKVKGAKRGRPRKICADEQREDE